MITEVEPITEVTLKLTLAELEELRQTVTYRWAEAVAACRQFRDPSTAAGRQILAEVTRRRELLRAIEDKLTGQVELPL